MRRDRVTTKAGAPTPDAPSEHEVRAAKALDHELEWFFSYAETAHRLGSVTLLPTHLARQLATQLAAEDDSEEATARRGLELVTAVKIALGAMPTQHAGVLRAVYTPRRWPAAVVREFDNLAPIVVRLVCAGNPWPARNNHDGLETAAAHHLAHLLTQDDAKPGILRKEARRLMRSAIGSYIRTRSSTKGGPIAQTA
jgi:hypothetical protein